eukprot:3716551-Pleurochrysis_carterae.AAC.1
MFLIATLASSANRTSSSGGLYASSARPTTLERSTPSSTQPIVGPQTPRSSYTSATHRCGFYRPYVLSKRIISRRSSRSRSAR